MPRADKSPKALALESEGWAAWLKALGPRTFSKPFAFFHEDLWEWYWPITQKRLRGERLELQDLMALYILGRENGKSSHVEWACIAEGALLGSGYVMYVCATESQAKDHVAAIRKRLESSEIANYYPGLSDPEIGKHGFRRGWSQEYLATKSGWGIIPVGLDEGVRGGRKDDMRFTMIVLDDIDDFKDSPALVEKKLNTITRSILPAGTEDTIILFPQNLIHENSVMNRIYTRRSDALSVRKEFGPHKSFRELELELKEGVEGRVWDIKTAVPTWPALDILSARKYLAKYGRAAFMAEFQHDFEAQREGKVLRNYDDSLMVIKRSHFEAVYGTRSVPANWPKRVFHDWARTKSAYHANVAGKLTVSNQNTPLPGRLFLFDLMSFEGGTQSDDVGKRLLESICPRVPGTLSTWGELIESAVSRAGLEQYVTGDLTRLIEAKRDVLSRVLPPFAQTALTENGYTSFVGSHDQNNDALSVYRRVYGLPFEPVNPGQTGGLEWIDHVMLVDRKSPHPFFEDELQPDGTYKLGSPGLFIIVEDDKYEYPQVSTPDALMDSDLCRYQFNNWRMRPGKLTEAGYVEHGPQKMNDDFGQGLQMAMVTGPPGALPLTHAEKVVEATPPGLRLEALREQSPYANGLLPEQEMSYLLARKFAEERVGPRVQAFDEWGTVLE